MVLTITNPCVYGYRILFRCEGLVNNLYANGGGSHLIRGKKTQFGLLHYSFDFFTFSFCFPPKPRAMSRFQIPELLQSLFLFLSTPIQTLFLFLSTPSKIDTEQRRFGPSSSSSPFRLLFLRNSKIDDSIAISSPP